MATRSIRAAVAMGPEGGSLSSRTVASRATVERPHKPPAVGARVHRRAAEDAAARGIFANRTGRVRDRTARVDGRRLFIRGGRWRWRRDGGRRWRAGRERGGGDDAHRAHAPSRGVRDGAATRPCVRDRPRPLLVGAVEVEHPVPTLAAVERPREAVHVGEGVERRASVCAGGHVHAAVAVVVRRAAHRHT